MQTTRRSILLSLLCTAINFELVDSFVSNRPLPPFALRSSLSMSASSNVVVVGSANQDLTAYTAKVPKLGETVSGSEFKTSCGGKGANQAIAAAKLGMAPVSMVCRVGQDSLGEEILENFRQANVEYDESNTVLSNDVSTGTASIVVDTSCGDNMIIVVPGANHELTPSDAKESVQSLVKQCDDGAAAPPVVAVQLEIKPETALEALRAGKEAGATTVLNTAPAPDGWTLEEFYPFIDILIANESELESIAEGDDDSDEEAMARSLLEKGVGQAVVVTLGARGAMIVEKQEPKGDATVSLVDAPADLPCRNDAVVDTIGAGDAFCGALSTYLSAGLDLVDAASKACGVASMTVRKKGAQSSYPTAADLPDCLKLPSKVAAA